MCRGDPLPKSRVNLDELKPCLGVPTPKPGIRLDGRVTWSHRQVMILTHEM